MNTFCYFGASSANTVPYQYGSTSSVLVIGLSNSTVNDNVPPLPMADWCRARIANAGSYLGQLATPIGCHSAQGPCRPRKALTIVAPTADADGASLLDPDEKDGKLIIAGSRGPRPLPTDMQIAHSEPRLIGSLRSADPHSLDHKDARPRCPGVCRHERNGINAAISGSILADPDACVVIMMALPFGSTRVLATAHVFRASGPSRQRNLWWVTWWVR
jgi:hypothetical protein